AEGWTAHGVSCWSFDPLPLGAALVGMIRLLAPSLFLLVVGLVATLLSSASGMRFWWAFILIGSAVLVNGAIATFEDDEPGGFNNPDGDHTPRYATTLVWTIRGIGVISLLLCGAALSLFFWG